MNKLILFLVTLSITIAYGQQKKLMKFLGSDFKPVPARTTNQYMETNGACRIVPSTTVLGDTSGVVYQNEYMLFRNYPNPVQSLSNLVLNYTKTTFVSNAEYLEFQHWVRDSIAREYIYTGIESDAMRFINISKSEMKNKKFYTNDRHGNRLKYTLNWNTKFSFTDMELIPILASMYLPVNNRFCKRNYIDERRLAYAYTLAIPKIKEGFDTLDFITPTMMLQDFWAMQSTSINDEFSVLGQVYDQLLPEQPAVGLTGMQANAFCHWKEIQLQQQINKKQLPYLVQVTLPIVSELTVKSPGTLNIPAKDYTPNWKITVQDYQLFMQAVRDSFIMEVLYSELPDPKEATKLIQTKPLYFDEASMEFVKFDLYDIASNREVFPLTENKSILKKYKDRIKEIETRYSDQLNLYRYDRMDIKAKTIVGELVAETGHTIENKAFKYLYASKKDSITKEPIGMDLNLDYVNILCQGSGVRSHERYGRFIIHEQVQLNPGIPIANQKSEDFIQGISYEQALAYYHWKYPISKLKSSDDWQRYVYPNEAQFKQIQKGEQVIIPQHEISFPTPVFRYVVTFIPVK